MKGKHPGKTWGCTAKAEASAVRSTGSSQGAREPPEWEERGRQGDEERTKQRLWEASLSDGDSKRCKSTDTAPHVDNESDASDWQNGGYRREARESPWKQHGWQEFWEHEQGWQSETSRWHWEASSSASTAPRAMSWRNMI